MSDTPFYDLLGITPDSSVAEIIAARNILAREFHPDLGGSAQHMALVNEAFEYVIHNHDRPKSGPDLSADTAATDVPSNRISVNQQRDFTGNDFPSFTVNALPVVAFEILLLAARTIGNVMSDEPPYFLEVLVEDPPMTLCHLEVFPDAGSSTVGISIVSTGQEFDVQALRDVWVTTINELGVSNRELPFVNDP